MDPATKCDAHNNDLSYDEGEERQFPARVLVMEHEAMQQITISYFFASNGVCSVHNLSRSKSQPQPTYYLFQTQPIHEQLHENLYQENGYACDHWSVGLISDKITASKKY